MNDRPLNKKYGISKNRYHELIHFTMQYAEWKRAALIAKEDTLESLNEKIKLVEETAKEAAGDLYPYILEAVTKKTTYENMRIIRNIPCGKNLFYELKRRYFYLLDKKRG